MVYLAIFQKKKKKKSSYQQEKTDFENTWTLSPHLLFYYRAGKRNILYVILDVIADDNPCEYCLTDRAIKTP